MARLTHIRVSTVLACVSLGLVALALLFPSVLTPYDPLLPNAGMAFEPPSIEHPFGTDQVGRDVWSRVVYGARSSVLIGVLATAVAVAAGGFIGSVSALLPNAAHFGLRRGVEVLMVLPELLLVLFVIAIIGPGLVAVFVALAIAAIPAYVNVSRTSALIARGSESVRMARVLGLSRSRIFGRYILVETAQPLLALASIGVGVTVLTAAGLSFLGLGVQPPTPDWGLMLAESSDYFERAWWLMVFPGLALTLTVISLSVLGRAQQRYIR